MQGVSQLLLLALAASVTLILADYRPPGDFYPEDKPIWPVPKRCPAQDPKEYTVHLAHESDCTKFYKCLRGTKILMECPLADAKGNKLHFNRILQVCDWPERAMCADNSWTTWTPSTESTTKRLVDPLCEGKREGELVPATDFCYVYYECINGRRKHMECEEGLQFYQEKQGCDIPDGTCWIRSPACPATGVRYIPHECCNRAYVCINGRLDTTRCDDGWYWNHESGNCTLPEEANCYTNKIC